MYPNRFQYKNAVLNGMFPDELNVGHKFMPVMKDGEPYLSSGGNAIVFKVQNDTGKDLALKLFSEEIAGRFQRLLTISEYLENSKLDFFTHFQFVHRLIYVEVPGVPEDDCYFPGVIMNWINGETLDDKIRDLLKTGKQKELRIIAEKFKDISLALLKSGIAHGDLKLSNILINKNFDLFLIDYDGMYVPALHGQKALETGTPSYQHPKRTEKNFDETVDHFSILNIYVSLLILSEKPELYVTYNDGDNIIFTKEDFEKPKTAHIFKLLAQLNVQKYLLYYLKKTLSDKNIYINNLPDLLNGNFPTPGIKLTQSPANLVLSQMVSVAWQTINSDFLKIDNKDQPLNGSIEFEALKDQKLLFRYGNELDTFSTEHTIKVAMPPRVISFNAQNYDLKLGEPLILKWKVKNAQSVVLSYNLEKIDVTNKQTFTIKGLREDTQVNLILTSKINDYTIKESIDVKIHSPVSLRVTQQHRVTFTNRPVKILIHADNAERVIIKPNDIDITGKSEYELRTTDNLKFQIIASNKHYSAVFESFIDVLKPPSYNRKVIELPRIQFLMPNIHFPIPDLKSKSGILSAFERKTSGVTQLLDKLNIFKLDFTRIKYENEKNT